MLVGVDEWTNFELDELLVLPLVKLEIMKDVEVLDGFLMLLMKNRMSLSSQYLDKRK